MNSTYQITGMTCSSCELKVKTALEAISGVQSARVSKDTDSAVLETALPIPVGIIKDKIQSLGSKYQFSETRPTPVVPETEAEKTQGWVETYKPVLLIFCYLMVVTLLIQLVNGAFDFSTWMRHFMGGFFLVFSFFKLLNLKGFAESYAMYDIVAKRFKGWGYLYAFLELGLGLAFITNFLPVMTTSIMIVVMSVSIIGVLQSVMNKREIKCACLGDVFNLPMSTITIIEDGLMIVMGLFMLWMIV